ncbi:unnamed protein product [Closterium sp. NIES-64]|nr:unnamed protein product [Closterium sp. NIES-64]
MATLRSVFILALVPALYAAAAPKQRGDVTAGGSAAVDAARWGRKLLEASGGADVHVGGEEEEVREVTDGLDEAVRVLLASDVWERMKKQNPNLGNLKKYVPHKPVWKFEQPLKASGDGLDEAVRVLLSWQKIKQMNSHDCLKCVKPLKSGRQGTPYAASAAGNASTAVGASAVNGRSLLSAAADVACNGLGLQNWSLSSEGLVMLVGEPLPVMIGFLQGSLPLPVMVGFLQGNPVSHWSGGVNLWKPPAVKPGDILVTHNVQRLKNICAFKTCSFFNAVPLTSALQFGMRLFQRGDVTAEGSASLDVASLGRKLLEASSGAHVDHVGGEEEEEEEEAGEVTDDGLDEAVRVLQSWKQLKEQMQQVRVLHGPEFWERMKAFNEHLKERNRRYGGLKMAGKPFVWKPKKPLKASANAGSSTGKGAKGALQAGGSSILKTMKKGV